MSNSPYPRSIEVLRRRRAARRFHRLGERALFELLTEIGGNAWPLAEQYAARLTPSMIAAAGPDRFPPTLNEAPK